MNTVFPYSIHVQREYSPQTWSPNTTGSADRARPEQLVADDVYDVRDRSKMPYRYAIANDDACRRSLREVRVRIIVTGMRTPVACDYAQ
ncbi:hypothetical protein HN011_002341 [Eciton burchellii]|nr:hypothetical protein HN011_002341 [Eciton burchellii]